MDNNQGLKKGALLRHNTYRIERILGQGGFGITYLATDLNLDRLVAIKEFFPKNYCDREDSTSKVTLGTQSSKEFVEKLKTKFLKEARNIAKFDYPGIIRIHAAFEENNTAYYVMDYIEGTTLSEMVQKNGPIPKPEALEYIEKVGEALEYVHKHRMNHLDVKPANVMVRTGDNQPILIDFGLSKRYDSEGNQTSTTPVGLSHGYAPMEQYNDGGVKEFSPQTDLYSLAATLYYILSGVKPPQALKLLENELTFPQEIPADLIKPISKAMMAVRKKRHESISAFLDDLKGVEEEDTEVIEEPSAIGVLQKQELPSDLKPMNTVRSDTTPIQSDSVQTQEKKSKPTKWIIAASGVVVLIGIFLLFFVKGNDSSATADSGGNNAVELPMTVKDLYWDSPLGVASYTGEIMVDSTDDKKIPHGKGVARIVKGEFEGSIYDGEFVNGKMEGQTTYTMKNGDTFVGTYKDNRYDKGKYTIKASGEYFEGSFKNGQPVNGDWYDKNGNKL